MGLYDAHFIGRPTQCSQAYPLLACFGFDPFELDIGFRSRI